ncbi:MAG: hypothetical protein L0K86_16845, partial [Actinomycetia bacterium]|nr:hypothetical protein [Actinomycetes bacterium]
MTTIAQLRKAALALPEVEEGTHFGDVAFSVRGNGFASVDKESSVQLRLPGDQVDAAVAAHPSGEPVVRNGAAIGFRVPLTDINGKDLNALVAESWTCRAPKRLVTSFRAAHDGSVSGDLPAIGKPATRALASQGATTLEQVATWTERDLLALHGVGPKAIRILADELSSRGMS